MCLRRLDDELFIDKRYATGTEKVGSIGYQYPRDSDELNAFISSPRLIEDLPPAWWP
jgi:hypothetical protein